MGKPAGELRLMQGPLERLKRFRLVEPGPPDQLEGDQPAELAVHGDENRTTGTATEQFADFIATGDQGFVHARHPATVPGQTGAE